jgi:hypothetical protein
MNILCKIFGHKMYFDTCDIGGPSTCKRCGHKEPAIVWTRIPMPEVKPPPFLENCRCVVNPVINKDSKS